MYMDQVENTRGVFALAKPDAMAQFAHDNGLDLRGHVLVWGLQVPAWVTNPSTPWTRASLLEVMQQWIKTMVGHYAGQVHEWDVVNEPLNDDGTLKQNIWEQVIGPDYIQQALIAAHQADPSALLFINEYSTEWMWPKSNALYQLAQSLLAQGVPLNGIGFQLHSDTRWPVPNQDLKSNMARFAALGLRTNVTEMDVGTSHFVGTEAQKQAVQAQIYSDAANACEQSPSCWSFPPWGFTDRYTWLGTAEEPLPFDLNYAPKPAWTAITAALR
jgi:endo-1,4-beta-xylanase